MTDLFLALVGVNRKDFELRKHKEVNIIVASETNLLEEIRNKTDASNHYIRRVVFFIWAHGLPSPLCDPDYKEKDLHMDLFGLAGGEFNDIKLEHSKNLFIAIKEILPSNITALEIYIDACYSSNAIGSFKEVFQDWEGEALLFVNCGSNSPGRSSLIYKDDMINLALSSKSPENSLAKIKKIYVQIINECTGFGIAVKIGKEIISFEWERPSVEDILIIYEKKNDVYMNILRAMPEALQLDESSFMKNTGINSRIIYNNWSHFFDMMITEKETFTYRNLLFQLINDLNTQFKINKEKVLNFLIDNIEIVMILIKKHSSYMEQYQDPFCVQIIELLLSRTDFCESFSAACANSFSILIQFTLAKDFLSDEARLLMFNFIKKILEKKEFLLSTIKQSLNADWQKEEEKIRIRGFLDFLDKSEANAKKTQASSGATESSVSEVVGKATVALVPKLR